MFGKVKKWFGIESLKMKLDVLEAYPRKVETVNGQLEFTSKHPETVVYIKIKLLERYERGRGESKKIDEYLLGEWIYDEQFEVDENAPKTLLFKLPFQFLKSPIEKVGSSNIFGKGIMNLAKAMKGAKSEYRLEAEAVVEGSKTNPYDKAKIAFI